MMSSTETEPESENPPTIGAISEKASLVPFNGRSINPTNVQNLTHLLHTAFSSELDFHVFCTLLKKIGLLQESLDTPLLYTTVRESLLHSNGASILSLPQMMPPPPPSQTPAASFLPFNTQRYIRDFVELRRAGKGGFGSVFHVLHRLDGKEYCVKKIVIKGSGFKSIFRRLTKLVREVRALAKLEHRNCVRYYGAWMEPTMLDDPEAKRRLQIVSDSVSGENLEDPDLDDEGEEEEEDDTLTESGGTSPEKSVRDGSISPSASLGIDKNVTTKPRCDGWNASGFTDIDSTTEDNEEDEDDDASTPGVAVAAESACREQCYGQDCDTNFGDSGQAAGETTSKNGAKKSTRFPPSPTRGRSAELARDGFGIILFIQMEQCLPSTLEATVSPGVDRVVDFPAALSIVRQITQGLEHVHSHGLCHRDLKPANCFFGKTNGEIVAKIGDFGLAREFGPTAKNYSPEEPVMVHRELAQVQDTFTHNVGTASYASPEQMSGTDCSGKADIFSLGLVTLEIFCPFATWMERSEAMQNARNGEFPKKLKDEFPEIAFIISRCLALDPACRPSASELLGMIDDFFPPPAVPSPGTPNSLRPSSTSSPPPLDADLLADWRLSNLQKMNDEILSLRRQLATQAQRSSADRATQTDSLL